MQPMDDLNLQQRQAVESGDGPVLIVAGPGTGKTKTLVSRIVYLLGQGVEPQQIVALTFTNKAARELEERLRLACAASAALPRIATFHSLGQELLRRHGFERAVASEAQQTAIIRAMLKPRALKGVRTRELGLLISRAKTSMTAATDTTTERLLQVYETALAEQGLWDFDELLRQTFDQLQSGAIRTNFAYVLVDEFQDTSELQYEILKLLGAGDNIFAIGDPNQSIYGFRGAGQGMFERFTADFPATQRISLTNNYRSRQQIVALANAVFAATPLIAQTEQAGMARIIQTLNEYSEAAYVVSEIERGIGGSDLLKASATDEARQPRDYAVLYRTHRAARALQQAFAASGLPYQIAGEGSPYERPAVQAVIAALRYLHDPADQPLPSRKGWSDHQIKATLDAIDVASPIAAVAAVTASRLELEDEGLQQLYSTLVQFGAGRDGLAAALQYIDAICSSEFYDPSVNAVTLMTIHASKGLEFEHVFLIAAEEGTLPRQSQGKVDLDEEERLFYVAITRARARLDILHAKTRAGEAPQPSRFHASLPHDVVIRMVDPAMAKLEKHLQKRAAKRAQGSLF